MTNTVPPASARAIELAGHALWLLPQHAVWHPATRSLFVADLHLGKAASFRALGQPVPSGTTRRNLDRLGALVAERDPARIVFLGDLLHAVHAQQAAVVDPLRRWRDAHPSLHCVLVRGNHDSHAGDPPAALGFEIVDEPWPVAGTARLLARHHPLQEPAHAVLAGHWHPAVTLRGPARDHQRLPCFCRIGDLLVLPSFGEFTGASAQAPPEGATCYPVGGGRVWPGLTKAR
jgi:DNA ligase-associated metallophosphoesterase